MDLNFEKCWKNFVKKKGNNQHATLCMHCEWLWYSKSCIKYKIKNNYILCPYYLPQWQRPKKCGLKKSLDNNEWSNVQVTWMLLRIISFTRKDLRSKELFQSKKHNTQKSCLNLILCVCLEFVMVTDCIAQWSHFNRYNISNLILKSWISIAVGKHIHCSHRNLVKQGHT